ncbi:MAG: hypothetical protein ACK56I_17650, partial [bacterium]
EILLVFAGLEEPRRQAAVRVTVDLRRFDVFADLLIRGKPDSAERFAAAEINISGSCQSKQSMGPAAGRRRAANGFARLQLYQFLNAPFLARCIHPAGV